LLALSILTLSALGYSASADDYFPFVQITCVPELRYFAIRSFGIANTPLYFPTNRKERKMLERTHGIYTAEALARTPFDCHASMAMNSTTTLDAHVETAGKGCADGLRVTVNGRDVGIVHAEICGQQSGVTTTQIEATVDNDFVTIRRCDLTFRAIYPELLAHDHDAHSVDASCRMWNPLEK
jgi:hypothetical protein